MREAIAQWWCRHFHGPISRPRYNKYFCWRCLREYHVYWIDPKEDKLIFTVDELERLWKTK